MPIAGGDRIRQWIVEIFIFPLPVSVLLHHHPFAEARVLVIQRRQRTTGFGFE